MKKPIGLDQPDYAFKPSNTVLIVGAGLAGCAIAAELAKRGYHCKLYDAHASVAACTSALPVAVVRPTVSGDRFYQQYFNNAFELCCKSLKPDYFTQCGSLELIPTSKQPALPDQYQNSLISAAAASTIAGTELHHDAIHIRDAGFIATADLCRHLINHEQIAFYPSSIIHNIRQTEFGWQLLSATDAVFDESSVVILATAAATTQFEQTAHLPLQTSAGQIDQFECERGSLQCILNGNGYLVPDADGIWSGATHHRNRQSRPRDTQLTTADTRTNRATAKATAPALDLTRSIRSFSACRTFTPDRLPIVGAAHHHDQYVATYKDLKHGKPARYFAPPRFHRGLYLATGLGSRGAAQALAVGCLLADLIQGVQQSAADRELLCGLHPARFLNRALKRGL